MLLRVRAAIGALLSFVLLAQPSGGLVSVEAHGLNQSRTMAFATPVRALRSAVQPVRVQVPEPARVHMTLPSFPRTRPTGAPHVRANGRHVAGPPMLHPGEIDAVLRVSALHRSAVMSQMKALPPRSISPTPAASPLVVPPTRSMPQSAPQPSVRRAGGPGTTLAHAAARSTRSLPSDPNGTGTGINPWWRYQEEPIPGGGKAMVNVGTGNLLVQDDDMSVAHKGIAMTFRRAYNSQSGHDVNNSDGAGMVSEQAGMYGNGWTNTFDAHMARSAAGDIFTVFDIDGARYDYTKVSSTYVPGAGNHNTLSFDGNCGFLWTKKSGTTYYFYRPNSTPVCAEYQPAGAPTGGYAGRLYQIIGRNRNTTITFSYAWDNGDASAAGKVSQIAATTESGQTATLYFGDVNGHRLLQVLLFPDGQTQVTYGYDSAGDLVSVLHPSNNTAGVLPDQAYGYQTLGSDSVMSYTASPRTVAACSTAGGCYSDGGGLVFGFAGTSAATSTVAQIQRQGVVNLAIPDSLGSGLLQSGPSTTLYAYDTEYYTSGIATPTYRDTDGHMTNWVFDGSGRPTQTQECTASASQGQQCTGTWLLLNESWDVDNNLLSQTDARGYETDFAYDGNGNAIAVAEPATTSSQGTFRPTELYDYDAYNNVTAYCDQTQTHAAGADWTGAPAPSDSLCSSHSGPRMQFTYVYPTYEPYGQLVTMATPLGYSRHFGYTSSQQGGADFGLPTSVTGDPITQLDGTTITPTQTFWYDAPGNLRCYSKGNGTTVLQYDALSRLKVVADPDDSSANAQSICGKSTGQGWNTQTTFNYFPDGSKQSVQTPAERAYGVATTYTYDLDGNVVSETAHHGCVSGQPCPDGTTQKFYDGADRLVEVKQAHDPRTFPPTPMVNGMNWPSAPYDGIQWTTRYLYDLSGGSGVSMTGGNAFSAYGNLYKTQTWNGTAWTDLRGSAFDALDRETSKFAYEVALGGAGALTTTQMQYDTGTNAAPGLLTSKTNPNAETAAYFYDELGRIRTTSYSGEGGVTPSETITYDPNGRVASIASSAYGTEQHTYDDDGRLTQVQEPTSGGVTSPALLTYAYYRDGKRSAVSVTSSSLNQTNLLAYSYRTDGALQTQALSAVGTAATWSKTYTDGGRLSAVTGADTQSRTYDGTGQLNAYTTPSGSVTVTHDPEESPLTETLPNVLFVGSSSPITQTLTNTFNVRGELLQSVGAYLATRNITDAGFLRAQSPLDGTGVPTEQGPEDTLNGVPLGNSSPSESTMYDGQLYPVGSSTTYNFDKSGRMASTLKFFSVFNEGVTLPNGSTSPSSSLSVKTTTVFGYDAENRTHTQTVSGVSTRRVDNGQPTTTTSVPVTSTIGWGPNGHPIMVPNAIGSNRPSGNWTLHWDGDMILFATDDSGTIVDVKAGLDADITPTDQAFKGLTVYDRDVAGVIVQQTNSSGCSGYIPSDASTTSAMSSPSTTGFTAPIQVPAQFTRPDGFYVGTIQINGVRVFHPDLGAWTTPDAYEGDIHDPASQQKYMWNRGNPIDYSDPSGYQAWLGPGIDLLLHFHPENEPVLTNYGFKQSGFRSRSAAEDHFRKHVLRKKDSHYSTVEDYVSASVKFRDAPGHGSQARVDAEGILRIYNPSTNTLGSYNPDGTTRTFFRPTDGAAYWNDRNFNPGADAAVPGEPTSPAFLRHRPGWRFPHGS